MAKSTSVSTIAYLNFITWELNRYIPLTFLFLGTIGNILNIMVFSRPFLRTNPCSLYFISGSIANFFALYIGLITPFLGLYNLDPTQKIDVLCKIRFYLRFVTITLSTWFVLLACVDRYFSCSANATLRSWSSTRLAKRMIILVTVICIIFPYTQVLYCYSIGDRHFCLYINNICELIIGNVLLVCNSGVPPMLMVIISILTIRNVKYSNQVNVNRRRDVQLIRILLIQVIILVLFATPITAQKIYSFATLYTPKSALEIAINRLFNQVTIEISYISSSVTFYVYSLTSKRFRKEAYQIFTSLFPCLPKKRNLIHPIQVKTKVYTHETIGKTGNQPMKLTSQTGIQ